MSVKIVGKCEVCNVDFSYIKEKLSKPDLRTCSKKCGYALRKITRHTAHSPTEKNCSDCNELFLDTSKKKLVDRCKKCVNESMVKTRRLNGSYTRSAEQNAKLSQTFLQKYMSGWDPNTQEHRDSLSKIMKARWSDGTMREKTAATSLEKYGASHWTQSDVGKKVLSQLSRGRKFSEDARRNMSQGAARRIRDNNNHFERGKGGFREDLGHYVRSNWEANFARILKFQGKSYEYEPKTFDLSNGKTYTPDFLVEDTYYEVKGYLTEVAKTKLETFANLYPDVKMQIIDGSEYDKLRQVYRDLVLWEGK